jgi:hypothetical protein
MYDIKGMCREELLDSFCGFRRIISYDKKGELAKNSSQYGLDLPWFLGSPTEIDLLTILIELGSMLLFFITLIQTNKMYFVRFAEMF